MENIYNKNSHPLLSTYYTTGILYETFLSFTTMSQDMYFCHSHITDEEIEAQVV